MPNLVTIGSFLSPWDAHIIKGLLISEGIPATLATEHHVWSNWPFSLGLGGVRLQVPEQFLTDAQEVLKKYRSGEYQRALEEQKAIPSARCASCGSTDLRYVRSPWALLLLFATFGLSGVSFPPEIKGTKCNVCGTKQLGAI